ncbi:PLDc N-terminal domain-containing protein [Gordonia sp. ABSL1-1]|uniref:PLDc N-terminal domain-containing protein n=1 Tax=Gordonia sp. ABSL1-1 TaxID=3053923 RepID=UPI0025726208|nr:PLDc N-terminal domain-containing protein [Gordonia sp. ABSL1-1]MDL9935344.1 PLDc N-terminal domain-containing protein [Gordonia sp. ABSL1-1]
MSRKKKFSELPPRSRALIIVGAIVQFALQAAALRDLKRRPAAQVNGPKPLWTALSFVNYFGPIAYFVVGRKPAE